ncbi:MAG TPA: FHA domain-containing protein, partial [Anaerolineales bacterium]|nr:FHA domain-containing protein [Anaerolineales bacterium]
TPSVSEPAPAQPPRPAPEPVQPVAPPRAAVPEQAGPLAKVSIAEPRITSFEAEIRKPVFRIGRASDNDGVLPVAATSGVSGHHCVIHFANGRWTIQDEQSKYGTTVDGQPIPKGQPFELHDGAVVGLGPKLRIQFHIVAGSNPNTPS